MTANEIKKAIVTTVPFGSLSVEGLMDENKNFYVSARQAVEGLNWATPNNATKALKRILGEDFGLLQLNICNEETKTHTRANVLTLRDFEKLVIELAIAGNEGAKEFARTLVGLSLVQVFSDAFGIKFEKEERQQWFILREHHRTTFPQYTAWLHQDGVTNYGKEVNNLKLHSSLPIKKMTEYTQEELNKLTTNETVYATLRRVGFSHEEALRSL